MESDDISRNFPYKLNDTDKEFCSAINNYNKNHGCPPGIKEIYSLFPETSKESLLERIFISQAKGLLTISNSPTLYELTALGEIFTG